MEAGHAHSRDHILTSHAGSLPRPDDLIEANRARESGRDADEARFQEQLNRPLRMWCSQQEAIGIDVPGDGEFGKSMGHKVNYRRLVELFASIGSAASTRRTRPRTTCRPAASPPGEVVLTSFADRRDRSASWRPTAIRTSGVTTGPPLANWPVCVGPVAYTGQDAIAADIANFKAALEAAGVEEGFMTSVAPGSAARIGNAYYKTDEEFMFACADAMREEYKAIVDAGLILQLDDPGDRRELGPDQSRADRRGLPASSPCVRVEALNHAIKGLPQDRIRFHLCWGSWHGPHTTDIPMSDIVEVMLAINCRRLFVRGRQRPPRARMDACGRTSSCPTAR